MKIEFRKGELSPDEQHDITSGFERHSASSMAPPFVKSRVNWLVFGESGKIIAALTGDVLWDWLYIDELWVDETLRGSGLGVKLMAQSEEYAQKNGFTGVWLWTQSWQAEEFYLKLGYQEFTRFPDFPAGHSRIGLRKLL
jgi:GNAT superfamily N-acetyltransferase